jgi:hypothetical protein
MDHVSMMVFVLMNQLVATPATVHQTIQELIVKLIEIQQLVMELCAKMEAYAHQETMATAASVHQIILVLIVK